MPGAGQDFLFLQGSLQQLTLMLTNPYSGFQILIDDEKFVQSGSYDGLGGDDFLLGTNDGDYISLRDPNTGTQVIKNIEFFAAGNGGDIVNLADSSITLNHLNILGSTGNDVLWGNVGNDSISGDAGDDILDGGLGHDDLFGEEGNDILIGWDGNDDLYGGTGSDYLSGGTGDDDLYYSADATWPNGFVAWNVGSPGDVINGDRVVVNPRYRSHDAFDGGDGTDTLTMGDDAEALFLDDRYSSNPLGYNTARIIDIEVISAGGGDDIIDLTSKQFSYGDVDIYGEDGDDVLWGNAGHDDIYGGDGDDHLDGAGNDDCLHGGDGDDELWGRTGDDYLEGGAGNDELRGGTGNDYYIVGEGADTIYADTGWDDLYFDVMDNLVDTVYNFNVAEGDTVDITGILESYDPLTDAIADFVQLTDNGTNLELHVNADGDVGGAFIHIGTAYYVGQTDTLENLVNNEVLIVA